MIRVLVAAASAVVRAGLEALILEADLMVIGSAPANGELAGPVEELQPDVVLIDLEGDAEEPVLNLLPLTSTLNTPAVVVLTEETTGSWVAETLRLGVRALLPRSATAGEIVAAVEAAAANLVTLHPDLLEPLLAALPTAPRASATNQPLTPREVEVLGMLAEGLGNKTVARRLGISEHTVKFHVGSIFGKLNATSRTEAVMLGARQGLIML